MRRVLMLFLLCGWLPVASAAADQATGTRIDLDATAELHLANDEVVVSFRIEKEGRDAAAVRQYVNHISGEIHKQLKNRKGLKLETVSRWMQPIWQYPKNRPRQRTGWRMVQSEQVVSSRLEHVPEWLDVVEKAGANLSGLQFRISSDAAKKARHQLRLDAIAAFREKAAVIAKGLDAKQFRILQLHSSSQTPQPVAYRAEMAMMAKSVDAAAPSLAAGEGVIRVTVSGAVETPFSDYPVR